MSGARKATGMQLLLPSAAGLSALAGLALPLFAGDGGTVATWNDMGVLVLALAIIAISGLTVLPFISPMGRGRREASGEVRGDHETAATSDPLTPVPLTPGLSPWERGLSGIFGDIAIAVVAHLGAWLLVTALDGHEGEAAGGFWSLTVAVWLMGWLFVDRLAKRDIHDRLSQRLVSIAIPLLFGVWLLILWQLIVTGAGVPRVLLPAPSEIRLRLTSSVPTLWADFRQTFMKAVLIGYVLGCSIGFVIAVLVDRVAFLRRGLLPVGNLVSALPIIGIAPIMVMWFGFDWPSKAAVVVIMTFFPMLVNTVTGLESADRMQRDLMRTYAAGYWQTLLKLRLPQALPFIFNALKINSTLALIGAIVAEFFGTPIVGMGFRISTEVGRMNVDMVWAEIAVAALAGSLFYGMMTLLERVFTFWHPSVRG